MNNDLKLRSSLFGFKKKDVVDYIIDLDNENRIISDDKDLLACEVIRLKDENEKLNLELESYKKRDAEEIKASNELKIIKADYEIICSENAKTNEEIKCVIKENDELKKVIDNQLEKIQLLVDRVSELQIEADNNCGSKHLDRINHKVKSLESNEKDILNILKNTDGKFFQ